ncbi:MAG TPA: nucleoside monophosphate kinase [Opitutales bacterium]|nr:nucleoside monophosphate kinase [Opitutales bacterium]
MKYKTFLIFGAPGSGKGTQGTALGTLPQFYHVACGEVFRSIDTQSPIGQEFLRYSSKGELVPDETTVALWSEHIENAIRSGAFKPEVDYLVLDGIPRVVNQAKLMEERIDVLKIFHLTCPDRSQLVLRLKKRALKENRLDDANEKVITHRLRTYEEESKPVLDFYGADRTEVIDAMQTPGEVMLEILKTVTKIQSGVEGDVKAKVK